MIKGEWEIIIIDFSKYIKKEPQKIIKVDRKKCKGMFVNEIKQIYNKSINFISIEHLGTIL